MRFRLSPELLRNFPDLCVGVVMAQGAQCGEQPEVTALLANAAADARARYAGQPVRSIPGVRVWRDAFTNAGINPNRYPPSVEALLARILKGGDLRSVNGAVDLANTLSLKYVLPVGAHDLDTVSGDLIVGYTRGGERFQAIGSPTAEVVVPGEVAYLDDEGIRTRWWVWRQSEDARVTDASRDVMFPIDGFTGRTRAEVEKAAEELAESAAVYLGAQCSLRILGQEQPQGDFDRLGPS